MNITHPCKHCKTQVTLASGYHTSSGYIHSGCARVYMPLDPKERA